ncbi:hypothetical protein HY30_15915 [Hyphomonas chukchiensis]|uniref:Major facilitator superfamily (MFS) profile domain-containing protein n=2 Tax=Hyphomonas chukchiensis TaxID=1280947 RepID=A0A062UJT7_9PROT|nr:hypothetical protein HY30_15915 [Hyphomonas chukchiensis]|tara:strand:+ start:20811 stop:22121 length:1311 start_codon:yes stop_codon:yes gene_type:complete
MAAPKDKLYDPHRDALYRKVAFRLMPLLIICYMANVIDRTNVGIAQVHMSTDLNFSNTVYGFAVGIFYLGYILFEIPSNLLLDKMGVRKTLLRIMVLWGAMSACTMLVRTPLEFYIVRFLLGLAEAGFWPGMLLYLTYWFPSGRRTQMISIFMMAIPISATVGPTLSGWIIHEMEGVVNMHGWQWMFVLEGIPAVILGVVAFLYLDDRPSDANWLSSEEKSLIEEDLQAEQSTKVHGETYGLVQMLLDYRVWVLGAITLGTYALSNAITFWSPIIIQESGVESIVSIGLLTSVAPFVGAFVMLAVARSSDRLRERRWHFSIAMFCASAALISLSIFYSSPLIVIAAITVATAGFYAGASVFSGIPAIYLSNRTRAGGIAMVTTIGAMAAMLSPIMMGWIRTSTGSFSLGLQISAGVVFTAGVVLLLAVPARSLRES